MNTYYMSFAGKSFLGAVVVQANGTDEAIHKTYELNLNPGGEILIQQLPLGYYIPEEWHNRLLDKDEAFNLPIRKDNER